MARWCAASRPCCRSWAAACAAIYPAFLVAFSIFLLLHFVAPGGPASIGFLAILENLLLLPGLLPIQPIMAVA